MPKNTVWGWDRGQVFPSFQALLQISYLLDISLKELLTQELDCSSLTPKASVPIAFDNKQRVSARTFDKHRVEQALYNALSHRLQNYLLLLKKSLLASDLIENLLVVSFPTCVKL
ncbi:hypothetical protein [Chroococcus sp. FPU101]|uniref:hypothetical protein n=1 Tax=Chroococcus sp. FPU101 TaxID=1974212 RepID=UPI001A8E75E3|nr:hypothetical protein [Chroococcus sp. FPU101]